MGERQDPFHTETCKAEIFSFFLAFLGFLRFFVFAVLWPFM